MRGSAATALVLMLGTATTGCMGDPRDGFATARSVKDAAEDAARSWDAAPFLVSVLAAEPATRLGDEEAAGEDEGFPTRELVGRADPDVGDGRAQGWLFVFGREGSGVQFLVAVDGNGTVVHHADDQGQAGDVFSFGAGPIRSWNVDSDQAFRIARDRNATWREALGSPGRSAFEVLVAGNDTDPWWVLGVESDGGGDEALAYVNAADGSYSATAPPELEEAFQRAIAAEPFPGPPPEGGRFEGTLSPLEPTQRRGFTITAAGHGFLTVTLRIDATLPTSQVNASVFDPSGELVGFLRWSADPGNSGYASGAWGGPVTGDWSAELRLEGGAAQTYTLDWCASDEGIAFEFPPPGPLERGDPCPRREGRAGTSWTG